MHDLADQVHSRPLQLSHFTTLSLPPSPVRLVLILSVMSVGGWVGGWVDGAGAGGVYRKIVVTSN